MFDTTKVIIINNTRNLIKKMKEAPVLYFIFTGMIVFSIIIFAFATFFILNIDIGLDVSLEDIFFTIFFIFMLKSAADFHNHFMESTPLSYSLSTNRNQKRTIFEILFAILLIQLILWFSFSSMYILVLTIFKVNFVFTAEYLLFTLGVIASVCLGGAISINFFSPNRLRLIPTIILLGFYFQLRHPLYVAFTFPLCVLQVSWSINNSLSSYLFSKRKERIKERAQVKIRSIIKTLFYRETTVLWRDKLLFSFILTAVTTGLFSGYLFVYGEDILIPEALRETLGGFLPQMFVFLGIYVVVVYTAVFPALNLFLNEEKTMWLVRHMPIKNDTLIYGKTSALSLCFLTSLPFIPYISIFMGLDQLVFLIWFLIFSYIAGIIVSIPLGVKYVGKKSDIMLLYSVAMILFAILGTMATLGSIIEAHFEYPILIYSLILLLEIVILYISLKLSSQLLALKY